MYVLMYGRTSSGSILRELIFVRSTPTRNHVYFWSGSSVTDRSKLRSKRKLKKKVVGRGGGEEVVPPLRFRPLLALLPDQTPF